MIMNNDQQSALKTVMSFIECYAKKDPDGCMSVVASSAPVFIMGTNENEVFRSVTEVRKALEQDFASMEDIRWGEIRHSIAEASGSHAGVIIELPVSYRNENREVNTIFRYALTLVREKGEWKICTGVASVPFKSGTYSYHD